MTSDPPAPEELQSDDESGNRQMQTRPEIKPWHWPFMWGLFKRWRLVAIVIGTLVLGTAIDGFFQPLGLTAAILTAIGALTLFLGSGIQAYVAAFRLEKYSARILIRVQWGFLFQLYGWILVMTGGALVFIGTLLTAVSLA